MLRHGDDNVPDNISLPLTQPEREDHRGGIREESAKEDADEIRQVIADSARFSPSFVVNLPCSPLPLLVCTCKSCNPRDDPLPPTSRRLDTSRRQVRRSNHGEKRVCGSLESLLDLNSV